MVFLACAATVIASQAVISGAFSVTRQAVQLGYLPRLRILHTSHQTAGQVYVPFVNWALLAAVLILVFAFERSSKLASAYGIAVTGTITITLTLFLVLMRLEGRWRLGQIALAAAVFGTVDLAFLGANLDKLVTGGWLPIVVGVGVYTVLSTWQRGRVIVTRNPEREEGSLAGFIQLLRICQPPVARVPGTAVFLNRGTKTTPLAMRENVDHNHTLHESAVILSIETAPVPYVLDEERLTVSDLAYRDDGISLCGRPLRVPAAARRSSRVAPGRRQTRVRGRPERRDLLPVEDRDRPEQRDRHAGLAQAAIPCNRTSRRRRRRLLPAAAPPHRAARLGDRDLNARRRGWRVRGRHGTVGVCPHGEHARAVQAFAGVNPVTLVVDAARALMIGHGFAVGPALGRLAGLV